MSMVSTGGYVNLAKIACPLAFDPANSLGLQKLIPDDELNRYLNEPFSYADSIAHVVPMALTA